MKHLLRRLLVDDNAQDLVEYALLTSAVGIAGVVAMNAFPNIIKVAYSSWNVATQAIWEPQDPQ